MARPVAKGKSHQDESVLSIKEQNLIILETFPRVSLSALEDVVFQGFSSARELLQKGEEWLAFSASERPQWAGKTLWIGFSESVPLELIDGLQAHLESEGLSIEREMGRALHNDLNPLARLSVDGLELLVPQPLVGTPGRKLIRGGAEVRVRGYLVKK